MALRMKQFYCEVCKKMTYHEDAGVDIPVEKRYFCMSCGETNHNPKKEAPKISLKEQTLKMEF